jgi:hypothetical protein
VLTRPPFTDGAAQHHEGFSMYDTNTRVHDCWDFDLTPGAKVPPQSRAAPAAFTTVGRCSSNWPRPRRADGERHQALRGPEQRPGAQPTAADPTAACSARARRGARAGNVLPQRIPMGIHFILARWYFGGGAKTSSVQCEFGVC